ncbi:MAG: hypothetical protein COA58_14080 [Bacteroidetes bacterium]|nr:MAG: hypothetical protein COA58_14080 [Bacteroidota bacterium]
MKYFSEDYVQFFKDLAANNHKEWFHSQRKRYEESVKNPFAKFTIDLIAEVGKHEKLSILPKESISRINRDIRFSKDKTPYNLQLNCFISTAGKKDKSVPGLFVRLGPGHCGVMGGSYSPDKDQLVGIRESLMKDGKSFHKLIDTGDFNTHFETILGETMKRIPKEYQDAAEKEPLILNKQFYYVSDLNPKLIASDKLISTIMERYHAMKPVNDYLRKAIGK